MKQCAICGKEIDGGLVVEKECLDKLIVENAELKASQERTGEISGETSDGYHTFNELYHHRAVLFSFICNQNYKLAWKSKRHSDGTMYKDMFIVGIDTPLGQATYHYDIVPYWEYFKVKEIENAPEWDGHTPQQAIDRLLKWSKKEAEARLKELEEK